MEILPAPALALREKGKKYLYKGEIRIWNGREFYCEHGRQPNRCKICCPEGYEKLLERNKVRQCEHGRQPNRCKICCPEGYEKLLERNKVRQRESRKDPEYRERERAKGRERNRKRQKDPEFREKVNARRRERRKIDPSFAYICNQRNRLRAFYKGKNKSASTKELLCCDQEFLKKHLESYFYGGMTHENYGTLWVIDHIRPLASIKNKDDEFSCAHWRNLQPLFEKENIDKSDDYNIEDDTVQCVRWLFQTLSKTGKFEQLSAIV